MATYERLDYGSPDGCQIGGAADKVGFFGTTPAAQRSGAVQAALTLTTATASGYGFSTATAFDSAWAMVEELRATLVAHGLMKGSA